MISVIFLEMGKHSNFQISSLQVVDVWWILQFNRKTEKYFKEFIIMVLSDAVTKLQTFVWIFKSMFQEV